MHDRKVEVVDVNTDPGHSPALPVVEQLYREERRRLVGVAYLLTSDLEEAHDVVQRVFLRMCTSDLGHVHNPRAYLKTAVVNECINSQRHQTRRLLNRRRLEREWHRIVETAPDANEQVELMTALSSLSAHQRTAVILHYFYAMSDEDVGTLLGRAPGSVRSLRSRALTRLRQDLKDWI